MNRIIIVLILSLATMTGIAQSQRITYNFDDLGLFGQSFTPGKTLVTSDARLPGIIKGYVNYLYKKPLHGWRVQLYFGIGKHGRKQAEKTKNQFISQHPDIPVYIFFEQPYFKVKVGNFTSRKSAERLLYVLKQDFPRAFIIEDRIDPNNISD